MRTALGFRAHSGWAALVAIAGTVDAPRVLERRRIAIADPELPSSKQPLPGLEKILAAHALIHTAEGAMFREVLVAPAH